MSEAARPLGQVLSVFNEATALAYTGGDRRLLSEVIQLFLENYPSQLTTLRQAVDGLDGQRIRRAAHALKGALGTLGAERALALSRRIEAMGNADQLSDTAEVCRELEDELEALKQQLTRAQTIRSGRRRR